MEPARERVVALPVDRRDAIDRDCVGGDEVADGLPDSEQPDRRGLGLGVRGSHTAPGLLTAERRPLRAGAVPDARPRHLALTCFGEDVGAVRARHEDQRRARDRAEVVLQERLVARGDTLVADDLGPRRDRDPRVEIGVVATARTDERGRRIAGVRDGHVRVELRADLRELGNTCDPQRLGGPSATSVRTVVVVEDEFANRERTTDHRDRDDHRGDPAARRRAWFGDHAGSPLGSAVPGAGMSSGTSVLSSSLVASG